MNALAKQFHFPPIVCNHFRYLGVGIFSHQTNGYLYPLMSVAESTHPQISQWLYSNLQHDS